MRRLLFIIIFCLLSFVNPIFSQGEGEIPSSVSPQVLMGLEGVIAEEYKVGPSDSLQITIFGLVNKSYTMKVSPEGKIYLPVVGEINVAGLSLKEIKEILEKEFSKYYKQFEISVILTQPRNIKVFVLGEVDKPGAYIVSSLSRVADAVSLAGGPTNKASLRQVRITNQNDGKEVEVDLYRFLALGDISSNLLLEAGDVIYLPIKKIRVNIRGEVQLPGIYELKLGENLKELINLAKGLTPEAATQEVKIERIKKDKEKEIIRVNLEDSADLETELRNGDIVVIPAISLFQPKIKVVGELEVIKTLRLKSETVPKESIEEESIIYNLAEKERVKDVVLNLGGPTPYADLKSVKIIRESEEGITKIKIDLYKLLYQNDESQNLKLQNGDILIVPSLYNVVYVTGRVANPSSFPYQETREITDYIGLAGGVVEGANLKKVRIVRIFPKREIINVNLKEILGDIKSTKVSIQPGDTIIVPRKSFIWRDYLNLFLSLASLYAIFTR